jgi:hypothetical protein
MIIYTPGGLELGFARTSDTTADIAYRIVNGSLAVGELLRVGDEVWRVSKITPSPYIKGVTVASAWLHQ